MWKDSERTKVRGSAVTRRQFLQRSGMSALGAGLVAQAGWPGGWPAAAAQAADQPLPTRVLGRTGEEVSILGLGTAPVGEGPPDVEEAERVFAAAMDRGVNYIDTGRIYGNAEEGLGHIIPERRNDLFLVTKCWTETADGAEESLDESLRLLNTDYVDLCHIHHIGGKNIDRVLADDGILEYLVKQKEAGKIRFIGLSGHARSSRFLQMLETGEIDVVMTVLNFADRNVYEFESEVLPACRERDVGVVAMKVFAGIRGGFPYHSRGYVGCATHPDYLSRALGYALDLEGVACAVVGPYNVEQAIDNVEMALAYEGLSDTEREEIVEYGEKLAEELGPRYGEVT
ncbi:MAG: aldo/keto reductase [Candidatus Hydrogenedentota bacterium]